MSAKATWIVARGGADIVWRCQLPAKQLGAKVILVQDTDTKCFTEPNNDRPFRWELTDEGAVYPDVEGTVVWTRPCQVRATHGAAMTLNGHRVVCEVDDNYLSPKHFNIFMQMNNYTSEQRLKHMRAFASMDAIICSTRWLRDEYHKTFKRELRFCPEMFVARNHVDAEDKRWEPQQHDGPLRVGIQGSHQHIHDWRLAAPALHLAKEMGCEIIFMGLDPAEHDPKWKEFLGDYTHIPWADPGEYHLKQIPFDIGLAPLVMNNHTLGKSDVKALEYTMSGAAVVAQNNQVYNREWKHGETALLAGSPDEMAAAVHDLIKDENLRERIVRNARQYVMEERTIQGNEHEWREALRI